MAQQDEVSGLRDIIKTDAEMISRALAKLQEAQRKMDDVLNNFGGHDVNSAEFDPVVDLLKEVEQFIKPMATGNRSPSNLSLGLST